MNQPSSTACITSRLSRRGWLWLGAGVLTAGAAGIATRRLWWPAAGAVPELPVDVCIVSPPIAHDHSTGLAPDVPRSVPAHARCPVCGMYPARYPSWAAQVLYRDGHAHFFDSPIDLFQFMSGLERHTATHTAADILSAWVSDARGSGWVAAEQAWYVHGSDVLGPMRMGDLPAFVSRSEADAFALQRGGQVLARSELTPAIIQSLSTRRSHALHAHE